MSILTVRDIQGLSAFQNKVRIPSGHQLSFDGNLKVPVWTTGTRPVSPEIGLVGYNDTTKFLELYNGVQWVNIGGQEIPADSGNGGGWSIVQGADGNNIVGFTNNSMTQYKLNTDNQGASNSATALSYDSGCPGGNQFSYHTGHQAGWWPMRHAIQVSTATKGKVLNQIQWQTHSNAVGNVDFFGSNKAITSGNWTDENNWSYLGRAHFGGFGGGSSDCTVYTRSFNTNNFGYQWYMIKGVDNNTSALSYPSEGSKGGWAMYRLRLNKV
jgi:hypothetical protein